MANGVFSQVFGRSHQLFLNKFFDPSTPSMRKVDDGEEKWGGERKNRENNVVKYVDSRKLNNCPMTHLGPLMVH